MQAPIKLTLRFLAYFCILMAICWRTDWVVSLLNAQGLKIDFSATRVSQLLSSTLTLWVAYRQQIKHPPTFKVRTKSANGWEVELVVTVNCEASSSVTIHGIELPDCEIIEPIITEPVMVPAGEIKQFPVSFRANDTARARLSKKWCLAVLFQIERLDRAKLEAKCVRIRNPLANRGST